MENRIVRRGYDRLPSVYGWDAFDRMLGELFSGDTRGSLFEQPQGYPTDIIEIKDENGQVTAYEVDVTLAGIPKENVDIAIEKDVLNISINKVEKEEDKTRTYVRKGISQRSMQLRYGLHDIDKEKIKADLSDGMLKVTLPIAEEVKPRKVTIG